MILMSSVVDEEGKKQSEGERINCMYMYQKVTSPEKRYAFRLSTKDGALLQIIQKKASFDNFWQRFV